MLVQAAFDDIEGSKDLLKSTKAILFLGTPHAGSPFADMGDTLRAIVKAVGFSTAYQNLRDLKTESSILDQCRLNFQTLHGREGFKVYTFQEELGMTGIGIAKADNKVYRRFYTFLTIMMTLIIIQVVPDISSEFLGSSGRQTINANHMMMCRYSSKDDVGYERVGGRLQRLCQDIQAQMVKVEEAQCQYLILLACNLYY
jgi:hypothetical protein